MVAFSSPSEIEGLLKHLMRGDDQASDLLSTVKVVAHGPGTATGAKGLGVHVAAVSTSFSSIEHAIAACLQKQ